MKDVFKSLRTGARCLFGGGIWASYAKTNVETAAPIVLKTQNGAETPCVACKICERICPANALDVKAFRVKNQWRLKSFRLDYARCDGCLLCVEACPVEALTVDEHAVQASETKTGFVFMQSENGDLKEKP